MASWTRRLELYFRRYQVTRPRKPSFERKRCLVKDLLAKRFPAYATHAIHAFALVTRREIGSTLPHFSFSLPLLLAFCAHDFCIQAKWKEKREKLKSRGNYEWYFYCFGKREKEEKIDYSNSIAFNNYNIIRELCNRFIFWVYPKSIFQTRTRFSFPQCINIFLQTRNFWILSKRIFDSYIIII